MSFIYPFYLQSSTDQYTNVLLWTVGSVQTIEWNTTIDAYDLVLYHQKLNVPGGSGVQAEILQSYDGGGAGVMQYTWTVQTYGVDTTESPVFFFWVNPGPNGVSSSYFNVTDTGSTTSSILSTTVLTTSSTSSASSSSSSASTSSSSTGTGTTTSTSTSSIAIAATASAAPSASPTKTASPSSTLPIGLGVGLGIGIPLILLIGIWLGITAMKQRRNAARGSTPERERTSDGWREPPPFSSQMKAAPGQPFQYYGIPPHKSSEHDLHEAPGRDIASPVEIPGKNVTSPVELG